MQALSVCICMYYTCSTANTHRHTHIGYFHAVAMGQVSGMTLAASNYRLHFMLLKDIFGKMQMIMTKNCSRIIRMFDLFVANHLNWKLRTQKQTHTHSHTQTYKHRKFASIVFLSNFLGCLLLWQISTANKYAIEEKCSFLCRRKLSNIYALIYYVLDFTA